MALLSWLMGAVYIRYYLRIIPDANEYMPLELTHCQLARFDSYW